MKKNRPVKLSSHQTVLEAEMVKNLLEGEGIEAYVRSPNAHALYPGVLGEVWLEVGEEDLERAHMVLSDSGKNT